MLSAHGDTMDLIFTTILRFIRLLFFLTGFGAELCPPRETQISLKGERSPDIGCDDRLLSPTVPSDTSQNYNEIVFVEFCRCWRLYRREGIVTRCGTCFDHPSVGVGGVTTVASIGIPTLSDVPK